MRQPYFNNLGINLHDLLIYMMFYNLLTFYQSVFVCGRWPSKYSKFWPDFVNSLLLNLENNKNNNIMISLWWAKCKIYNFSKYMMYIFHIHIWKIYNFSKYIIICNFSKPIKRLQLQMCSFILHYNTSSSPHFGTNYGRIFSVHQQQQGHIHSISLCSQDSINQFKE